MADLFNNTSNDYVNPSLAPCAGQSDENVFQFLPGQQAGIVSGSSVIAAMSLNDIKQSVEGWVQQTKMLQPGEVTFIPGLTKGITNELEYFPFIGTAIDPIGGNHALYMTADISINYYNNFRYYDRSFRVISSPTSGIDIANAFNMLFSDESISVTVAYDPSGLTFTGNNAGYTFNITNLDVSIWDQPAAFYSVENLPEDTSSHVPAFKYPNGAMLGYVLKVTYPTSTPAENDFVMINHVPDFLEYFTYDGSSYVRNYKAVDVGFSGISSDPNIMSAGEYLDWITTNKKWEKVGVIRIWLTALDPADSAVENLITGFYVFNPQIDTIKLDYMTIL